MKSLRIALLTLGLFAAPAVAGAPWMSIEVPANPMDRGTQGAFAVIHTYLHERPMPYVVTGTAEGLVNGARRSQALSLSSTGRTGTMALRKNWGDAGVWVLKLGVEGTELGAAIGVDQGGDVAFVRIPLTSSGAQRQPTMAEIESMLRALAAGERVPALQSDH